METSVDELIGIFRESLNALVPPLRKAKLLDEKLIGYDGADSIFEALFREIVEASLLWSLPEFERDAVKLPQYGMHQSAYTARGVLTVTHRDLDPSTHARYIFVELVPNNLTRNEFSHVRVAEVTQSGNVIKHHVISILNASFAFCYTSNGKEVQLTKLIVDI